MGAAETITRAVSKTICDQAMKHPVAVCCVVQLEAHLPQRPIQPRHAYWPLSSGRLRWKQPSKAICPAVGRHRFWDPEAGWPHASDDLEDTMATGETGFDDVTFDLISLQYHSLKAGHDYGQYVRDAKNAGKDDIASFFEKVMTEDSARAKQCHEFLSELGGIDNTQPQ